MNLVCRLKRHSCGCTRVSSNIKTSVTYVLESYCLLWREQVARIWDQIICAEKHAFSSSYCWKDFRVDLDAGLSCPPEPQLWKFENAILNFSIFFAILTEIVSISHFKNLVIFQRNLMFKEDSFTHLLTHLSR